MAVNETEKGMVMSNSNLAITISGGRITSIVRSRLEVGPLEALLMLGGKSLHQERLAGSSSSKTIRTDGSESQVDRANVSAWDVEYYHLDKAQPLELGSVQILEEGPLRATVEAALTLGSSTARVQISLDAVTASLKTDARSLIRFDVEVDWHEQHKFLKFELPTTIWSPEATYDAAFGVVKRPTHRNTSWDAAKFEVCAHKFADRTSKFGLADSSVRIRVRSGYSQRLQVWLFRPGKPHALVAVAITHHARFRLRSGQAGVLICHLPSCWVIQRGRCPGGISRVQLSSPR